MIRKLFNILSCSTYNKKMFVLTLQNQSLTAPMAWTSTRQDSCWLQTMEVLILKFIHMKVEILLQCGSNVLLLKLAIYISSPGPTFVSSQNTITMLFGDLNGNTKACSCTAINKLFLNKKRHVIIFSSELQQTCISHLILLHTFLSSSAQVANKLQLTDFESQKYYFDVRNRITLLKRLCELFYYQLGYLNYRRTEIKHDLLASNVSRDFVS